MTPEEIQGTITNILRIQSELQQTQLKNQAEIAELKETSEVLKDSIEILAESLRLKSDRIDRQISTLSRKINIRLSD